MEGVLILELCYPLLHYSQAVCICDLHGLICETSLCWHDQPCNFLLFTFWLLLLSSNVNQGTAFFYLQTIISLGTGHFFSKLSSANHWKSLNLDLKIYKQGFCLFNQSSMLFCYFLLAFSNFFVFFSTLFVLEPFLSTKILMNIKKLQIIKNIALHIATGCTWDHLHDETIFLSMVPFHFKLPATQLKN